MSICCWPGIAAYCNSKGGYDTNRDNHYAGSRNKILLRYKYQYKTELQYGIVAEKDAGEGGLKTFQNPFDFTSFHFFKRSNGLLKSLAVGDYTVNLGQGLIHWQALAFGKSSEALAIVRQSPVLRPYHGAGEFYFNRGVASHLSAKRLGNHLISIPPQTFCKYEVRFCRQGFHQQL